jgi:predicted Zn finger-like uncharacterized protein
MLIACPSCATSYDLDAASLRPDGRQVRCARCRTVWRAELSQAEKLIAAAEALAPVRRAVEAMAEAAAADSPPLEEPPDAADHITGEPSFGASEGPPPTPPESMAVAPEPSLEPSLEPVLEPGFERSPEIGDVEVESPSIAPVDLDGEPPTVEATATEEAASSPETPAPQEDIESVAARRFRSRAKRKTLKWPLSQLQSGILALIIIDAIVVGWRADFVRALPQTASFYAAIGLPVNLRGLSFDSLATVSEQHEGVPILVVEGNIINSAGKMLDVPRLRFAVRNAAREEIYSWTAVPPRAQLSSGEGVGFRTRLASPPPDAHDVLVRFVNRIDMLAGTR